MSDLRKSLASILDLSSSKVKPYKGFIFLCGGRADALSHKPVSVRDAIYRELVKQDEIERRIRLAEHYKEWSHDGVYRDLVSFEKHLAELSSAIVLVLESPGAIAELGLFSAIEEFQKKLLVFIDSSHYQESSFIRLGPVKYLEDVHDNKADCYRWLKVEGSRQVYDSDLAEALQPELAESVKARVGNPSPEQQFSEEKWLHATLLICDLLNLLCALTVREIRDLLDELGIKKTETEVRQTLFLLEKVKLIVMEPRGEQRFYIAVEEQLFIKLHITDAKFDANRFRMDAMAVYEKSDRKRYRAIQQVRNPGGV